MVVAPYGDHWRNLRRISTLEIFSTNRLNMFLGIRRDEVKHLIRNLSRNLGQDFAKVELKSMFSELTFNIIMRMVAGKRYYGYGEYVKDEEEARQFREIIKEAFANAGMSNPGECVPLLRWIDPGGLEKRLMGLGKKIDAFLEGLIDEKRNSQEKGNTMIDHLLSLQTSQPDYYTDQIIKGLILFHTWPQKIVPLEDMMFQVKQFVLVNAWAIHRNPKLWDDATSFKPERFESGEGDAHKLMPFGIGRRACPGAGLAQRTISLALGSLIQCFEWKRVDEAEVDMAEGNGVTMPKAVPLEAMCRARPIMNKVLYESVDV
ncbi:Cytochrome P450 81D1 [Morella rubra]|uniref:Cytochrome P450 81D1 n=1 Tax=Morella rubra TaxID=262757 RepID=A0A6A1WAW8_9ROSI|nr:Cytochrome P450 81D1 [Morella rubra]